MRSLWVLILGLVVLALVPAVVLDSYTRHLFLLAFVYAIVASNSSTLAT